MITQSFSDYRRYRPFLRQDFQFRCAYCLRHEFFVGGEAGCVIDHHRPRGGRHARPDLAGFYGNLYWCCAECNSIKGDTWPSPEEFTNGRRFLDPCVPEDDHDFHWRSEADGSLEALTPVGEYTIAKLALGRESVAYHRACMHRWHSELGHLERLLNERAIDEGTRRLISARLAELANFLNPPRFDRPRSARDRTRPPATQP